MARMAASKFNERERERIPAQVPVPGMRPRGVEARKRSPREDFGEHARHTVDVAPDENVPGTLDATDDTRNAECREELEEPGTDGAAKRALVRWDTNHDESRPEASDHPPDPHVDLICALGAASPVPRVPAEKNRTVAKARAMPGAAKRNESPAVDGGDGGVVLVRDDGENTRRICDVKLS